MLDALKRDLVAAQIIKIGEYDYFVHPLTDGIPAMDPMIVNEIIDQIMSIANLDCDLLLAPEAMGIPIIVPISLRTGIPYGVVRKRRYGLPGEVCVRQRTGYSDGDMFINGVKKGDKVVLMDDVMSTGGTIMAIVLALKKIGAEVVDVVVIVEKGDKKKSIEELTGTKIKTLVRVEVRGGKLSIID